MELRTAVDATHLPRTMNGRTHPMWTAVLLLVFIEITVLLTLLASYGYLRLQSDAWPPAGATPPPALLPTVNLLLILGSAATMWWSGTGTSRGSRAVMGGGTALSVLLASCVLGLRALEMRALDFSWSDHAYGSIVWLLLGFHFIHVSAAIVGTLVVSIFAWRGYYTRERHLGVVVDALYWYFVAAAWIPVYYVTVWDGRIAG